MPNASGTGAFSTAESPRRRERASAAPPFLDLMREIAALESDDDLRVRYEKLLSAASPKDLLEMDVHGVLYR